MHAQGLRRLLWTVFLLVFGISGLSAQSPQSLPDAPQPQKTSPPPEPPPIESSSRDTEPAPSIHPRVDQPAQPDTSGTPAPNSDLPDVQSRPAANPSTPDTQH